MKYLVGTKGSLKKEDRSTDEIEGLLDYRMNF